MIVVVVRGVLLRDEVRFVQDPKLVNLGNLVELGVVEPVALEDDALPPGEVARVDGDTVVVALAAGANALFRNDGQGGLLKIEEGEKRTAQYRSCSRRSRPVVSGRKRNVMMKAARPNHGTTQNCTAPVSSEPGRERLEKCHGPWFGCRCSCIGS